jgi:hypothetical protein
MSERQIGDFLGVLLATVSLVALWIFIANRIPPLRRLPGLSHAVAAGFVWLSVLANPHPGRLLSAVIVSVLLYANYADSRPTPPTKANS